MTKQTDSALTSNSNSRACVMVACLLAACLLVGCGPDSRLRNYKMGGDFALTGIDGKSFNSRQLRGRTVLLFFGFTNCPDICPATLSRAQKALALIGPEAKSKVRVVFVTVDPARDTPVRLKAYLARYNMPVIGLTGSVAEIQKVALQYGGTFSRSKTRTAAGYLMNHVPFLYLVDERGTLRYIFKLSDTPRLIATLTKSLL